MIRLLIPLCGGITLGSELPFTLPTALLCWLTLIPLPLLWFVTWWPYRFYPLTGVAAQCACFFLGLLLINLHDPKNNILYFGNRPKMQYLAASVDDPGVQKTGYFQHRLTVRWICTGPSNWAPANGHLILKTPVALNPGELFVLKSSQLQEIDGPKNPGAFNYKQYLARQQVYHQLRLFHPPWLIPGMQTGTVMQWIYPLQKHLRKTIGEALGNGAESAVALALLYGDDDYIDRDLTAAYARTGTLHVLAVSGMHVGIIFLLLTLLMKPLEKIPRLSGVRRAVILIGIWLYALLCGMSPSILRATVMLSLVMTGGLLKRSGNGLNTLAGSGILLLAYDPQMLFNTGFQLSYLAVAGILLFHSPICAWFTPRSWIGSQVWELMAVSIAAQLLTLPVGLYCFNQFPLCFLLSNLVVIPLTSIALYAELLLVAFSFIPLAKLLLGKLIVWLIASCNSFTLKLAALPWTSLDGIYPDRFQCVCLFAVVTAAVLFIQYRNFRFLISTTCFSAVLVLPPAIRAYNPDEQLLIFHSRQHTFIALQSGGETTLLSDLPVDQVLHNLPPPILQHLKKLNWRPEYARQLNGTALISRGKNRIVIVGAPQQGNTLPDSAVLLFTAPPDLHGIMQCKPANVILCATLKSGVIQSCKSYCLKHGIPCFAVSESGAITVTL